MSWRVPPQLNTPTNAEQVEAILHDSNIPESILQFLFDSTYVIAKAHTERYEQTLAQHKEAEGRRREAYNQHREELHGELEREDTSAERGEEIKKTLAVQYEPTTAPEKTPCLVRMSGSGDTSTPEAPIGHINVEIRPA